LSLALRAAGRAAGRPRGDGRQRGRRGDGDRASHAAAGRGAVPPGIDHDARRRRRPHAARQRDDRPGGDMSDLTYRSPKTEVKASAIEGKGLFAKEAIVAGEIVAIKGGRILTREQWKHVEPAMGSAEIQIDENFFIAPERPEEREGSMLYTNHSCEPNI